MTKDKQKPSIIDQKKGHGLVSLETHQKIAAKQNRKKSKGGPRAAGT